MENLLLKYMDTRLREPKFSELGKPRPFITISREFGCPSKIISKILADQLNLLSGKEKPQWHFINKEIIEHAARELELDPIKIQHIFSRNQTGMIDDLISSFSSNYKSSLLIKKTIREVTQSFISNGNVILVGRGSVAITHGKPNSLHIRLQAPLDWRAKCVSDHKGIPFEEAKKLALETDAKRTTLIESFLGEKFDSNLFDAIFNCKTLSNNDIVSAIIFMMQNLKMI